MQFNRVSISELVTDSELMEIALKKAGVVRSIGGGFSIRGGIPTLPEGWDAKWTNTHGEGNRGTLVLVGTDARTRGLLREGKIRKAVECGLTEEQAKKWHKSKARYKHELLRVLALALQDKACWPALLDFPNRKNKQQWAEKWAPISEDYTGLSVPRLTALSSLLRDVLER
jgi:hypothetical protein